jgi:hypothetical protein
MDLAARWRRIGVFKETRAAVEAQHYRDAAGAVVHLPSHAAPPVRKYDSRRAAVSRCHACNRV